MGMMVLRALPLALMVLLTPAQAKAQEQNIVVRGDATRIEIERILEADNLDTARLSPREVVDIVSAIERGRAPPDFWDAYQRHVQAWVRLAETMEQIQRQQAASAFVEGLDELVAAEAAVSTTFDEVERIARSYGAQLPLPLIDTRTIA
jgi:hypothetical protein